VDDPWLTPKWLASSFTTLSDFQQIGAGGQKIVFQVKSVTHGLAVLKIFKPGQDPNRISREIQAAAKVNSNLVPRIFDSGISHSDAGEIAWVLEQKLNGQTLRQVLSGRPANDHIAQIVLEDVLHTLVVAEQARVVHRDIKPDNIILVDNHAYLIDFGIARILDEKSLTETAEIFGLYTIGYCSPEQLLNKKNLINTRSDIYSLGVTVFECLEGYNPFLINATSAGEVLQRLLTTAVPAPTRKLGAHSDFQHLILGMTRRRPDHRIQTAANAATWAHELLR